MSVTVFKHVFPCNTEERRRHTIISGGPHVRDKNTEIKKIQTSGHKAVRRKVRHRPAPEACSAGRAPIGSETLFQAGLKTLPASPLPPASLTGNNSFRSHLSSEPLQPECRLLTVQELPFTFLQSSGESPWHRTWQELREWPSTA